jgi:hypothetical protein
MKQEVFDNNVCMYKRYLNDKADRYKKFKEALNEYNSYKDTCKVMRKDLIQCLMDNVKNYSGAWRPISYDEIKYIMLVANRIERIKIDGVVEFTDFPINPTMFKFENNLIQVQYQNKHVSICHSLWYNKIEIPHYWEDKKEILVSVCVSTTDGSTMEVEFVIKKEITDD